MSSAGLPPIRLLKASSAAAMAPPPSTELVGVAGAVASQRSRAPRTCLIQSQSGCAAPLWVMQSSDSSMAAESVIAAECGQAAAHEADVDPTGACPVWLQVGGQLIALAEPARGDPGPCVRVPRAEQGRKGGVFGRWCPVAGVQSLPIQPSRASRTC